MSKGWVSPPPGLNNAFSGFFKNFWGGVGDRTEEKTWVAGGRIGFLRGGEERKKTVGGPPLGGKKNLAGGLLRGEKRRFFGLLVAKEGGPNRKPSGRVLTTLLVGGGVLSRVRGRGGEREFSPGGGDARWAGNITYPPHPRCFVVLAGERDEARRWGGGVAVWREG